MIASTRTSAQNTLSFSTTPASTASLVLPAVYKMDSLFALGIFIVSAPVFIGDGREDADTF